MDRISRLPNEVICHIVSFLSAKEAAFATVLSKRLLNLFTIIPNHEFDDTNDNDDTDDNQVSLNDFLDGLLSLPPSSRIKSFSLKCRRLHGPPTRYADVNRLLCNVLKRGVLVLKLDIWVNLGGGYSLPFELFTCKTLVELKLESILEIILLPENALLPALKTLVIDQSVRFNSISGCALTKLLSACPVLVDLVMRNVEWEHWEWSRTVSSKTLERLTINHRYCFGVVEYDLDSITFDTPRLTYLKYFDFAPKSYPIVKMDSLVEATVGLTLPRGHDITNLIKGLRNVEILDLYATMTMEAFYIFRKAIPVFEKLNHLSVTTEQKLCWRTLPYLLKKSPNLKTLVIVVYMDSTNSFRVPLHYYRHSNNDDDDSDYIVEDDDDVDDDYLVCECVSEYSFLLSCPVKVLEITEYSGRRGELVQMKHILEKMSCLELVKVCADETDDEEQVRLRTNLLNLPRSSNCKIEFEFIPPRRSFWA